METTGRELTILTEKDVQKVSLSALRSYYRFRVKSGTPELISDVRGAGGIIADVQYSFPQEDGSRFLATLEATAADSKEEVYYQRNLGILLVDSVATSSFATALLYMISHVKGLGLVIQYPIFLVISLLLASISILSALFFLILKNNRRYRYIYAVEQFKQYYANEQWIAISDDVFPDHQNHYFEELRAQCVQYGFGLIQIDQTRKPYLIITPARREVFENQRQKIILFSLKQLKRLKKGGTIVRDQLKKVTAGLPRPAQLQLQQLSLPVLQKLTAPFNPSDPKYLFRFKRSYQNQQVVIGFAVLTMIGIGWREYSQRPTRFLGVQQYAKEVIAAEEARGPEPIFIMDPFDTIYLRPFDTTVVPYFALLRSEHMIADGFTPQVGTEVLIGMFDDALILYDCERLYNFQRSKYMVQEGVYADFEMASRRMSQLITDGLEVNCLWMGCFSEKQNQYVLYFGLLQNTLPEAQKMGRQYQQRLAELRWSAKITIRMLSKFQH